MQAVLSCPLQPSHFSTITKLGIVSPPDVVNRINSIASAIKGTKPTMSALENTIDLCKKEFADNKSFLSLNQLKSMVLNELENQTSNCISSALDFFLNLNTKPLNIITCSYSSTFIALANKLNDYALIDRIFVLESKWKSIIHSQNTIEKLRNNNINAYEICANELKEVEQLIDCVIIGADRVLADGSVINGVPSLRLAEAINGSIPLYVVAEKIKKSKKIILEDGFELIPSKYVKKIFE